LNFNPKEANLLLIGPARQRESIVTLLRTVLTNILVLNYCDLSVVTLMRSRSLGNSPTALCNEINEIHSKEWMRRTTDYLSDCKKHKEIPLKLVETVPYDSPPVFKPTPTPKWFLSVYLRDVWGRLDLLKALATLVYDSILKIDSTKKITKKLQGIAANSASWCTNVGNEDGSILLSLLTTSESNSNLKRMADGLIGRYERARIPPPILLYTDRDCCKTDGPSKFQRLFSKWDHLIVRLDSWHFSAVLQKHAKTSRIPSMDPSCGRFPTRFLNGMRPM
jgi:hypothetical protein